MEPYSFWQDTVQFFGWTDNWWILLLTVIIGLFWWLCGGLDFDEDKCKESNNLFIYVFLTPIYWILSICLMGLFVVSFILFAAIIIPLIILLVIILKILEFYGRNNVNIEREHIPDELEREYYELANELKEAGLTEKEIKEFLK